MHQVLMLMPLLIALAVAAAIDLRQRRIPNWLTLSTAAGGLAASVCWTAPLVSWWQALLGGLVGLIINWPLFALRIRGGGDVKLFAAVGTWVGPFAIVGVFLVATVVAMFVAIVQAVAHRRLRPVLRNSTALAVGMVHGAGGGLDSMTDARGEIRTVDRHLPYAVPITLSVLLILAMN